MNANLATLEDTDTRAALADGARAVSLALLIGLATWLAIDLTRPHGGVTVVWLASGLLTGILLTTHYRLWILYIVAALAGNLFARWIFGDSLALSVTRGIASSVDAWIVAFALRFLVGDVSEPNKLIRVTWVAIVSTLAGCALSSLLAALASAVLGFSAFVPTFVSWFASHALGMVVFATLTGVSRELGWEIFGRAGRRWRFARTMGLVGAVTLWVFAQSRYPLLFLVNPPLILAAFRHRFAGFAFGLALVVVVSIAATINGVGPLSLVAGADLSERTLLLQIFLAITCLTTLPVAVVLAERGRLVSRVRASERNYRMLAHHSRDLVVRMRPGGERIYVSPSVTELLGWRRSELTESRWDLIHGEDRAKLIETMNELLRTGEPGSVVYRVQHKHGYYVWIEALARRVPGSDPASPWEIVYSGRDVSQRVQAEQALAHNQRRLRAIADNLPALVAHVDMNERFTFVNEQLCEALGRGPERILAHTMPDVLGWRVYNEIRPRVQEALGGERVEFEVERVFQDNPRTYHATYVPDRDEQGRISGFVVLLFDISELKSAQRELALLARQDSLTGLANRRHFAERVELALARQRRDGHALALLYLDIDHFKAINDSHGHAAGDAVLRELARRLSACVRETDLAARLGGDEFVVLVEDVDQALTAESIAGKLLDAIRAEFAFDALRLGVTATIGVGIAHDAVTADILLGRADAALYAAKSAGRNTYRVADAD